MSPELWAALLGAVAGGILALLGGIAQVFIQGWISERGKITCDVVMWTLIFEYTLRGDPPNKTELDDPSSAGGVFWAEARTYRAEPSAADSRKIVERFAPYLYDIYGHSRSYHAHLDSGRFHFTANFLNTKGTNAAVLEYSIQFLKDEQTLVTKLPSVDGQSIGQAMALPAENVAGFAMSGRLDKEESEKIVNEVDSAVLTAHLSTGRDIRVELERLSHTSKGVEKEDAT
jgi:hypothetical protein